MPLAASDDEVSVGDSPIMNITDFKKMGAPKIRTEAVSTYSEEAMKMKYKDESLFE